MSWPTVEKFTGYDGPLPETIDELEEILEPHAERLGCLDELRHLRTIYHRGTSAHHQVRVYEESIAEGCDEEEALRRVAQWLIKETQTV